MQHVIPIDRHPAARVPVEIKLNLRDHPGLADHRVQGLTVLPGSLYLDLAAQLHQRSSGQTSCRLRDVRFELPAIVSEADTILRIDTREHEDQSVEYRFGDGAKDESSIGQPVPCFASLTADIARSAGPAGPAVEPGDRLPDGIKPPVTGRMSDETFHRMLSDNGNCYGPRFRNIAAIWRGERDALGELRLNADGGGDSLPTPRTVLLDVAAQVLASFLLERARPFVLKSIDEVELHEVPVPVPGRMWARATLAHTAVDPGPELKGDVEVFDDIGRRLVALRGVVLTLLEGRPEATIDGRPEFTLQVAANFTAEPVEDALQYWSRHFNVPVRIEFAPYNQVFQQLLHPGSGFHRNRDGVNVLLLQSRNWTPTQSAASIVAVDPVRREAALNGHARHTLPNGMEIAHLNSYETEHLYREIFEEETYLKHGIHLPEGATVIDVGANIGLFSLFVSSRCRNPRIFAFEPSPVAFEILQANGAALGPGVRALSLGVGSGPGFATFTCYKNASVFSGFHADADADRQAIRATVRNALHDRAGIDDPSMDSYVDELTRDRMYRTTHRCRITSLSEFIASERINRIDLLKIDAEKSELEVLAGIAEDDWPKINQLVIEVHDPSRRLVAEVTGLLGARGFQSAVEEERSLEGSGLFNVYARRGGLTQEDPRAGRLRRTLSEFHGALATFLRQNPAPVILCRCPEPGTDPALEPVVEEAGRMLRELALASPNLRVLDEAALDRCRPAGAWHDPLARELGHIPYTAEGFGALGTALFRTLFNLKSAPFKVIALDGDNTLWKGVCAEDGPQGVALTPPYRALQEFMVERMRAGLLLCLCSKNDEQDVWAVFARRADLPLKRDHLAAWRINWQPKSANLRELAAELNLGLDSFVFIDDNPLECAEVRANLPEVLTLQLPADAAKIPAFLEHVWALDPPAHPGKGSVRTQQYQEQRERERFRQAAMSLGEFIRGLELKVEIGALTEEQHERVAELTVRTNQFNFTTQRRSPGQLREFLRREGARCLGVHVADRFGDYGLVGVVLYEIAGDRFRVDTLLLSCRVLGRGVEHQVLAALGREALKEGIPFVELVLEPTARNLPAQLFLRELSEPGGVSPGKSSGSATPPSGNIVSRTFSAEILAGLVYDPERGNPAIPSVEPDDTSVQTEERPAPFDHRNLSAMLQRIAETRGAIDQPAVLAQSPSPGAPLEEALAGIWQRTLRRPRHGLNENFFDAGGTSLKAVQLVATIKRELGRSVSLTTLFECPTIQSLADRLNGSAKGNEEKPASSTALERGRRRRSVHRRMDGTALRH